MAEKRRYVLIEQTDPFLEEAKNQFSKLMASLNIQPGDTITAWEHPTKGEVAVKYTIGDGRDWSMTTITFNKYFVLLRSDDTNMLEELQ